MKIFTAKRVLLLLTIAAAFLVGYAGATKAWPLYGRDPFYGYFTNVRDTAGDDVFYGGIPHSVNTADKFINFILAKLSAGPGTQDGTGAAFIIQTMIGSSRNKPPTATEINTWIRGVKYAELNGWLHFETVVNYRLNSMYQGPCTTPTCTPGGPNPIDDTFYDESATHTDSAIVFTDGTKPLYQIRYSCANPIGVAVPLVIPNDYHFDGESFIDGNDRNTPASLPVTGRKNLLVWPGDTVRYFHFVWNWGTGGGTTRYAAWKHPRVTVLDSAFWTLAPDMAGAPFRPNPGNIFLNAGENQVVNWNAFTIPNTANVGDTFCQHIGFIPTAWNAPGPTDKLDKQSCAEVAYHYSLDPIAVADKAAAQQGDSVTFTYSVHNSGPTTSRSTACSVVGNNRSPGYTPLPQQNGTRTSDPGYVGPGTGCPRTFAANTTPTLVTETITIGNLAPGSRVCRSLVIDPKDQWGGALTSEEACVVIAKAPYVHFTGNDVWAGGNFPDVSAACDSTSKITTVAKTLSSTTAGSLGEYGAFALGKITNFGSASKALVDPVAPTGKMLTFSNTNSANLGFFGAPQHCINSYISAYNGTTVTSQPGTIDVGGAGNGTWHTTGNHTFRGTMPNGSQKIYLVEGDVTIDNDLKYTDSYGSLGDIPSLVIIATGSILVRDNVKQMDGIFVAKNTFNTCSNAPSGNLSVNDCKEQLTVHGSVIAGRLSLMRTYGAEGSNDDDRKRPSEIFYTGAEMYLRNALTGSSVNTMRVVDERDLPPRY